MLIGLGPLKVSLKLSLPRLTRTGRRVKMTFRLGSY